MQDQVETKGRKLRQGGNEPRLGKHLAWPLEASHSHRLLSWNVSGQHHGERNRQEGKENIHAKQRTQDSEEGRHELAEPSWPLRYSFYGADSFLMVKIKTKLFIWWWLFSLFFFWSGFVLFYFYFAFGQVGFVTFLLWMNEFFSFFYEWKENKNEEEKTVILLCTYWVAPAHVFLKCSVPPQQFQGPLDYHISLIHWSVWLHWFMTRTVFYSVGQMSQLHHAESPSWNKQTNNFPEV